MKKYSFLISLFFFACSGASSGGSVFSLAKVNQGDVIVTVNGLQIRQGMLDTLKELNPRIEAQLENPLTRRKILDSLVEQQLLYQEAVKRGIDKSETVTIKSLLNKHVIVSNSLIEQELEETMKKEYEAKKDQEFTNIAISMIGANFKDAKAKVNEKVTDEEKKLALDKIKKIKARLDKGEDFATVAKETSDDELTAKKGGDAGEVSKDDKRFKRRGLQAVVEEASKLKKDQISEPVETTKGYYIVKVTSDPKVVPFEDAKKTLGFELQATVKKTLIDGLKKDAKITYADATAGPAPDAAMQNGAHDHSQDHQHVHDQVAPMEHNGAPVPNPAKTQETQP